MFVALIVGLRWSPVRDVVRHSTYLCIDPPTNAFLDTIHGSTGKTFRHPATTASTITKRRRWKGRRCNSRENRHWRQKAETWEGSRAKWISVELVHDSIYVRVHSIERIERLTKEWMVTARWPCKWSTFKDLIEKGKRICEIEATEGRVMEEGVWEGVAASGPSAVVGSMLRFGWPVWRRRFLRWGPNAMNIIPLFASVKNCR